MFQATPYQDDKVIVFYGVERSVVPVTTAHGATLGYLPGQSVGHYRDGFLQSVTVHESPYDARAYRARMNVAAKRLPMPYLNQYHVL